MTVLFLCSAKTALRSGLKGVGRLSGARIERATLIIKRDPLMWRPKPPSFA